MSKILYLECAAGISGDMTVAALLDAGASEKKLLDVLESVPVQGFRVEISRVRKSGLDACDFNVILDEAHENHDHDMAYLHGAGAAEQAHEHAHTHSHSHSHSHEHRCLADVLTIINATSAAENAKAIARRIFEVLAHAEAKAHGEPVEAVHFHEVGAIDSIVDVLAIAVCVDDLGITDIAVTELAEGKGTVRCQHGVMPVPVPAVTNIAAAHNLPLHIIDVQGELVTPTGAAAAAALRTRSELPERFVIKRVGLGAGKRAYATSGILRALIIEEK